LPINPSILTKREVFSHDIKDFVKKKIIETSPLTVDFSMMAVYNFVRCVFHTENQNFGGYVS